MSNTVTQYLRPSHWSHRRSSMSTLSETKVNTRPRSNSSGGFVVIEQNQILRSPSPSNRRRFSYSSEVYNIGSTPVTVVRGNSPSVIECAIDSPKKRKILSIKVILLLITLLLLAILGILGVFASKMLPKQNSYCLGEHFCIPVRASKETPIKLNLSALKERVNAGSTMQGKSKHSTEKRRTLFPRLIPRVIGKINTVPDEEDKSKSSGKFDKTVSDVLHSKLKSRSPFMPRETDRERESQMMHREWNDQWDNRRFAAPPGVNPKIYWKTEL